MLRYLEWDSNHFGLKIGRTENPHEHDGDFDCIYFLCDSPEAMASAQSLGFRFVDVRVTLSVHSLPLVGVPMRTARTEDIPYLSDLAANSHHDSRFYVDGRFPREACDRLFRIWIERSCMDKTFAQAVFVPEIHGKPAGYITCAIKNGIGDIGLIAIDPNHRKNGIGRDLLTRALRWFHEQGAFKVEVVTQGSNVPALRMYGSAGFRIESVKFWLHWWNPRV